MVGECILDSTAPIQGQVVGSSEHGIKSTDLIKGWNFLTN